MKNLKKALFAVVSMSVFATPMAFAGCYENYSSCLQNPDGMDCDANLNYCLKYSSPQSVSTKDANEKTESKTKSFYLPSAEFVVKPRKTLFTANSVG